MYLPQKCVFKMFSNFETMSQEFYESEETVCFLFYSLKVFLFVSNIQSEFMWTLVLKVRDFGLYYLVKQVTAETAITISLRPIDTSFTVSGEIVKFKEPLQKQRKCGCWHFWQHLLFESPHCCHLLIQAVSFAGWDLVRGYLSQQCKWTRHSSLTGREAKCKCVSPVCKKGRGGTSNKWSLKVHFKYIVFIVGVNCNSVQLCMSDTYTPNRPVCLACRQNKRFSKATAVTTVDLNCGTQI